MEEQDESLLKRRFSDEEIRAILTRAAELQRRQGGARSSGEGDSADESSGTSLEELQGVAREAGLDPALIREAAAELDQRPVQGVGSRFLGEASSQTLQGHVDAILQEEDLEELLVTLDAVAGEAGQGHVSRSTLSWATDTAIAMRNGYQTRVQVRSTRRGTDISVRTDLGNLAGGLYGGLMGGVGLGAGLGIGLGVGLETLGSPAFAVLFPLGMVGVGYLLARSIFTGIARRRRRRNRLIVDELVAAAEDLQAPPDSTSPVPR